MQNFLYWYVLTICHQEHAILRNKLKINAWKWSLRFCYNNSEKKVNSRIYIVRLKLIDKGFDNIVACYEI